MHWLPVSLSWAGRSPRGGRSHPFLFQSLASGSHQCPKYLQNKEEANHSSMSPPVPLTFLPCPGVGCGGRQHLAKLHQKSAPLRRARHSPLLNIAPSSPPDPSSTGHKTTPTKPFNNHKHHSQHLSHAYPVLSKR